MACRLKDIVVDSNGDVCGLFQWFYRHSDLLEESIGGVDERPSEVSRTRELWLCGTRDLNSMRTVIGKLRVRDLAGAKGVTREDVESYINESEHNYFTRRRVDSLLKRIL